MRVEVLVIAGKKEMFCGLMIVAGEGGERGNLQTYRGGEEGLQEGYVHGVGTPGEGSSLVTEPCGRMYDRCRSGLIG